MRFAIFLVMAESRNKLVEQLVTLLRRATAIAEKLQGDAPQGDASIAADVAEKIAKRICLVCGATIPEGKQYRRGLDARHYQRAMRNIQIGKYTEADLMEKGALGPRGVGGPKTESTVLDDLARALEQYPPTPDEREAGKEAAAAMKQKIQEIGKRKKAKK